MLLKIFLARVQRCRTLELEIKKTPIDKLPALQEKINAEMKDSVGMFNFAFPLVLSAFFMIMSFAIVQFSLWQAVTQWLLLPPAMTMVFLVIGSLVCSVLYIMPIFIMSKGFMAGAKLHLILAYATLFSAVIYFLSMAIGWIASAFTTWGGIISASLVLIFIGLSLFIIRTERFYSSLLFTLYCRTLRKLQASGVKQRAIK
ncbi:hypothetical protein ACQE32_10405 [Pantoea sp. FN0302]|uniref:hypothetical protein n=1 Tax=Pantoea sp. FN0302 TaxID=3418558 RepID=UPI003CF9CB42